MRTQSTQTPMLLVMGTVGDDGKIALTTPLPPASNKRMPKNFFRMEVSAPLLGSLAEAAQHYSMNDMHGDTPDRLALTRFAAGAARIVGDASTQSLATLSMGEQCRGAQADRYYARAMLIGRQKDAFWKPEKVASFWAGAVEGKRTALRLRTLNLLLLCVFAWDLAAGPNSDDEVFEFAPVDKAIQEHCGESFYPAFARFKTSHECREGWLKHRNSLGILKEWKPKWVAKEAWKLAQSEAGKDVR